MLGLLRRWLPRWMLRIYHRTLAWAAMWWYGRPSRHLVVIGVTGTDGKTTTAVLIAELLKAAGRKVGLSSSVYEQVVDRRRLNQSHLTMPGRFALQHLLRDMVKTGCQYAVLEVSSEGIRQHRHTGIDFDVAVLTNLSREHLEAHGGFEAYRHAKGRLFERLAKSGDKTSLSAALKSRRPSSAKEGLTTGNVKRVSVVNLDDQNAEYFLKFWADQHHGTSLRAAPEVPGKPKYPVTIWSANEIQTLADHSSFMIEGQRLTISLAGRYNVANALQAIVVARLFGVDWTVIESELAKPRTIPGRGESIDSGRGFRVIVDYALTPSALEQFYQSLKQSGAKRIIAVFGAAGGGRDRWKRPELGAIASHHASVIIITTDDPYDEDPAAIAGAIAAGIPASSRAEVLTILDRRQAIAKAMLMAQPGDAVAVTGMGAETSMLIKGKKVPWSDTEAVKQELIENKTRL